MDKFKQGEDVFCTQDGKAQDRIPNDLSQMAIQEGTVINAKRVNSWTEEIVNAIKKLGLTPDRNQENQFSLGINKRTVYNQVGEVNSWLCSKEYIPKTEAVLDGTTLKPEDYEDGLATLKQRCPSWISGGNIQLPNYNKQFQRFSSGNLGGMQQDAMRRVSVDISSELKTPKMPEITITGKVSILSGSKSSHSGYRTIANVFNHLSKGALSRHYAVIVEYPEQPINFKGIKLKLTTTLKQEGNVESENRPKNFAVIMSVVVGIPKKIKKK